MVHFRCYLDKDHLEVLAGFTGGLIGGKVGGQMGGFAGGLLATAAFNTNTTIF